jgi:hypothetical protein
VSRVSRCSTCDGNIIEPAYEGDGVYPVAPMCSCAVNRLDVFASELREIRDKDRLYAALDSRHRLEQARRFKQ